MDLTTGAPQRLWRLVGEALRSHDYNLILWEDPPSVNQMPIGDTGTTYGTLAAEHPPEEEELSGEISWIRLALGFLLAVGSGAWLAAQGTDMAWAWVLLVIGAVLAISSLGSPQTRYQSRVIGVELRGEVYASEAELADEGAQRKRATARRSLVSDVELVVRAACLESEPDSGNGRTLTASLAWQDCPNLKTDFETITGAIQRNIQPVVQTDDGRQGGAPGDHRG